MKYVFVVRIIFFLSTSFILSQEVTLRGTILDIQKQELSFVNVFLIKEGASEAFKGTSTDDDGNFEIKQIPKGAYVLQVSILGYKTQSFPISLIEDNILDPIILLEDPETLSEVIITSQKPIIQKKAGMLIFNVEQTSLSVGNTLDLLSKTPGVLVLNGAISIKNQTATIYLNGRRVYLSPSETTTFLQNLDASAIKQIEVITNPSSQFDAEAGTVLNIITSKSITPGYKGSISSTYEQAIFAKYILGTSHFYKNNWVNLFASYNYSPRKENKDEDSFIRFFDTDEVATTAIWEGDFNRITRSFAHQVNLVTDFTINDKNTLNVSVNTLISPNKTFKNIQETQILNAQRALDSTFLVGSNVETDLLNISLGTQYKTQLTENTSLNLNGNYITFTNDQFQNLESNYFLPNGDFLNQIAFETTAAQETEIITAETSLASKILEGDFNAGIKFSNINTQAGLDYFDNDNGVLQANNALSDLFNYEENIFAGYFNYDRSIKKWQFSLGVRAEQTEINGISESLGEVNTQNYFNFFPSLSVNHQINENNSAGIGYSRKIQRPRYQSLNPFRYFINENNFNQGNPNLVPAIEDKISLNYSFKNKWSFEAYYQKIENSLEILSFQDNQNFTLRQLDANLIDYTQFSFDVMYSSSIKDWWYASYITSTYYLENVFFAEESTQETYKNHTMGFFASMYNQFTLSKDGSLTSDVTGRYISNLISGSLDFNNIFDLSISISKTFWDKAARINVGVVDLFNTNNIPVTSNYLNQDNSYFARPEARRFIIGFTYNLGNFRLKDNNKNIQTNESERLN